MSQYTLAEMVRKVGLRIGVKVNGSVIGSSNLLIQQLVELFNEEITETGSRYLWSALIAEATFTTLAQEDQGVFIGSGGILEPSALFHHVISDTMWDRTARQPVPGPESSFDWQARKALLYTSGPFPNYRIRANRLLMSPVPTAGHTIAFEYATKRFVYDPDEDTYGSEFESDDSVPVIESDLIIQGVRWRWKMANGFKYAEEQRIHQLDVANASSRDVGGRKTLNLGGGNSVLTSRRRAGDLTTTEIA